MTDEKKACVISRFCCRRGREQNVGNNWPREGMERTGRDTADRRKTDQAMVMSPRVTEIIKVTQ